jgi:hypothetical protein
VARRPEEVLSRARAAAVSPDSAGAPPQFRNFPLAAECLQTRPSFPELPDLRHAGSPAEGELKTDYEKLLEIAALPV